MLEAAIFDLDGVLSDSESFYEDAMNVILGRYGHSLTTEERDFFHGIPSPDTWDILSARFQTPATSRELLSMEEEFIDSKINSGVIPAVPFAFDFLRNLKESGLKIAIATNNYKYRAEKVAEQNDATSLVDVVVGYHEVEKRKPAPDLFLLAAKELGVSPENCVVFEDSPSGAAAAKAAGMKLVLYAHPERAQYGDCGADLVFATFENMSLKQIVQYYF